MRLKILLPTEGLTYDEVTKVTAEAEDGSFTLLPRHIDFIAGLVPGILSFETPDGNERILAIDEGTLLKCGSEVLVSTRHAVQGNNLGELTKTITEQFLVLDEHEKKARSAALKLEANLVRRFLELRDHA